nr:MAG TPA: hypothetical protein [Caudoviricetes sp.]
MAKGSKNAKAAKVEAPVEAPVVVEDQAAVIPEPIISDTEEEQVIVSEPVDEVEPVTEAPWRAEDHLTDRVPVRSAVYGTLIYVDSLTRREWTWSQYGMTRNLTIETLENARNSQEAFFVNGWWEIDPSYEHKDELLDYLDATHLYSKDVNIDNFDALLRKSAAEITAVISKLSVSQKVQLARRAQELIKEGRLDSMSAIRALEKTLGTEFEY